MPANLVDDDSVFVVQRGPVHGDPLTPTAIRNYFGDAANRAAYVKRVFEENAQKIRAVANLTALRALTAHDNDDIVIVTTYGEAWIYVATATATDNALSVAKPDDVSGSGRWINMPLTYGSGVAFHAPGPLTSAGKVPPAQIYNGALSTPQTLYNLAHSTTSTSFVTIGSDLTVSAPDVAGYLEIAYDITADPPSGSLSIYRVQFVDPASATGQSADIEIVDPTGTQVQRGGVFIHPSNPAGTWSVRLQVKSGNGSTASTPRAVLRVVAR